MGRLGRLMCGGVVAVGMVGSGSGGRVAAEEVFQLACVLSDTVDTSRGAAVCDEFLAAVRSQPEYAAAAVVSGPLTRGPGIEVRVDRASDIVLELTPTWLDRDGRRIPEAALGIASADRKLSAARRSDLYLRLLGNRPF